jgi:hypothetical protein
VASIAYISRGALFVKRGDEAPVRVESRYAEQVRSRARQAERKNAWKTEGAGATFMRGGALWGARPGQSGEGGVHVTSVARGPKPGELLYSLGTADVGGIFLVRRAGAADAEELRLYHSADLRPRSACASEELVACALSGKGATQNLAAMRADGSDLTELTDGDSIDDCPRWRPGPAPELVFQSAGLGRDGAGRLVGIGPSAILQLRCDTGAMETLLEDPATDFVAPRPAPDGGLYFIRRPHRAAVDRPWYTPFLDVLLFIPRLLWALVAFLNFFGTRYTGRPLLNSGDARRRQADVRQMMVWGNLLDAEKNAAAGGDEEARVVVPDDWALCHLERGAPASAARVLARGVVDYDVGGDGTIVWSDGASVHAQSPDGRKQKLVSASLIGRVAALD